MEWLSPPPYAHNRQGTQRRLILATEGKTMTCMISHSRSCWWGTVYAGKPTFLPRFWYTYLLLCCWHAESIYRRTKHTNLFHQKRKTSTLYVFPFPLRFQAHGLHKQKARSVYMHGKHIKLQIFEQANHVSIILHIFQNKQLTSYAPRNEDGSRRKPRRPTGR